MKIDRSDIEFKLLDFSLLDLLILQHLYQLKQQITRYKLMQQIQATTGNHLSTAKFYRILTKLEKHKLVEYTPAETPLYYITPLGLQALDSSKRVLGQVGMNVTTFFNEYIDEIVKFSRYTSGRILYIDFPQSFDIVLMNLIKQYCQEMAVLCEDSTFKWLANTLQGIKHTIYENDIIKEPDNSFDLIILFYPGIPKYPKINSELFRTLKPNKNLLIMDSKNPLKNLDHFVVEVLINQFWPFDYTKKRELSTIENEISSVFKAKPIDSLSVRGLELRLFEKAF